MVQSIGRLLVRYDGRGDSCGGWDGRSSFVQVRTRGSRSQVESFHGLGGDRPFLLVGDRLLSQGLGGSGSGRSSMVYARADAR